MMDNTIPTRLRYLIGALILGVFISIYLVYEKIPAGKYPVTRHIRYSFTLQNTTNQLVEHIKFMAYGPVKKTSIQHTEKIQASIPYSLKTDKLGNQLLYFDIDKLAPFATKIISISALVRLTDTPNKEPLKQPAYFLKQEKYVETSNPKLISLAKQFKSDDRSLMVHKINDWINGYMNYTGYIKNNRGALYAYETKKGDCTEYMYLFTALSRINGMPTRAVGGYVSDKNGVLKAEDFHNWAEVYIDGAWRVADVQKKKIFTQQHQYLAMQIISAYANKEIGDQNMPRFMVWNDSISVTMN